AVTNGWNLIGSVSSSVSINKITTSPTSIIRTPLWGRNSAYYQTAKIDSGKAYWVKIALPQGQSGGTLTIDANASSQPWTPPTTETPPDAPSAPAAPELSLPNLLDIGVPLP